MALFNPNTELVAIAWLKGVPGLPANSINTTLPKDNSTWAASGFVQIPFVVGGNPDFYIPVFRPIVQVNFWGVNVNGAKPPWGKAAQMAQRAVEATWKAENEAYSMQRTVSMHVSGYKQAHVFSAYFLTEPRRIPNDDARMALYSGDLQLHWKVVEP